MIATHKLDKKTQLRVQFDNNMLELSVIRKHWWTRKWDQVGRKIQYPFRINIRHEVGYGKQTN